MVKMTIGTSVGQPVRRPGNAAPGQPALVAPVLLRAPQLSGAGRIGTALTADPGLWSGSPLPTLRLFWQLNGTDIPDATGISYLPEPVDDLASLSVRVVASNAAGSAEAASAPIAITHAPPQAVGSLADVTFVQGPGVQQVSAGANFTGESLVFTVTGAGATINPSTGEITLPTEAILTQGVVTVQAENSGGTAVSTFRVTVTPGPSPFSVSAVSSQPGMVSVSAAGAYPIPPHAISPVAETVRVEIF
jgi:hypothetical protein